MHTLAWLVPALLLLLRSDAPLHHLQPAAAGRLGFQGMCHPPAVVLQAWMYWNKAERTACVAFRGTEQGQWQDILTDLHLVPAPLDTESVAAAHRHDSLGEVSQPEADGEGTMDKILRAVEEAKQQKEEAKVGGWVVCLR